MTRRRKDPFAGKENVRHFRLVHRPLGSEVIQDNEKDALKNNDNSLSFDDLFEEYDPLALKHFRGQEVLETEELYEDDIEEEAYDFVNDDDGEMVDIDAELDRFEEGFIDIEGEDGLDHVKLAVSEENVGEAAKYGILLDDRDYDYTKHLRRVGITPGAVFIQAPGMKMKKINNETEKKPRDFFASEEFIETIEENEEDLAVSEEVLKINHEIARQQYRTLLQQVGDDPILREVIEALEDDRYVTGEFDDELVISLDNMNINENDEGEVDLDEDFFDENVEILEKDQEFPDFIPSEALKRQMEKIAAQEEYYMENEVSEERDEFDDILDEYEDEDEDEYEEEDHSMNSRIRNEEFVDIENENEIEINSVDEEKADEIYKYLREHGRARGSTLYDKKRPSHLPPIHVAIAQYNELRRELSVNNDFIIEKYAQEDEEETNRQIMESEMIIEQMVKIIDDPKEMEKRLNIDTAKYLLKLSESVSVAGPRKIVEVTGKEPSKKFSIVEDSNDASSDEESDEVEIERINKGVARSTDETAEEKKARKSKIKAEKKEKRAVKAEKNNRK